MAYLGPRVLPQPRQSGASPFLTALGAGFDAFNQTRETDRQKKRQVAADERDVEQHTANMARMEAALAGDEMDLYNAGVRKGDEPDPLVLPGIGGGVSVVPRSRPLTDGRYIDTTQTPEFKARQDAQTKATMAQESMKAFYEGAPDWFRSAVGEFAPGTDYRGMYDDALREHGDDADRAANQQRYDADREANTTRYNADRSSREKVSAADRSSREGIATRAEAGRDRRATATGTGAGARGLTPQQALTFGLNVQDGAEAGPDPALARQLADSVMKGGALPTRDPSTGEMVWPRPTGKPQEVDRPTYGEVMRDAMRSPMPSASAAPASTPADAPPPRAAPGENPAPIAPKPGEAGAQSPPPPPPVEGGKPAKAPISEATKARARANPALRDALKKRFGYSDEDFEPSRQ